MAFEAGDRFAPSVLMSRHPGHGPPVAQRAGYISATFETMPEIMCERQPVHRCGPQRPLHRTRQDRLLIRDSDLADLRKSLVDRGGIVDQRGVQAMGCKDTQDVAAGPRKPQRDPPLARAVGKPLDHVGAGRIEQGHR